MYTFTHRSNLTQIVLTDQDTGKQLITSFRMLVSCNDFTKYNSSVRNEPSVKLHIKWQTEFLLECKANSYLCTNIIHAVYIPCIRAIHVTSGRIAGLQTHVLVLTLQCFCHERVTLSLGQNVSHRAAVEIRRVRRRPVEVQFSVSDESETSASRACRLRTFQCKHSARLSNQSYTRSWQQMEGTG